MEFLQHEMAQVLLANFAIIFASVILLWLVSIPLRDVSIIDMAFAVILWLVTVASYTMGDGAVERKQLILALVTIWAVRITWHLVRRNWGHGEDVRYTKLRSWVDNDRDFIWLSLRKVFLLQGIVLWLVSLPVQIAPLYGTPSSIGPIAIIGALIAVAGIAIETVADIQLTRFRGNPANKGTILNTGLWRYSRHPNYFGELCTWWGLFVIAAENPVGLFTIIGPLAYTYLIVNVTGQRTLDKKLARERPGYSEYMQTTSGLIPWPPKNVPHAKPHSKNVQ